MKKRAKEIPSRTGNRSLLVYCAAGLKTPVAEVAHEYEKAHTGSIRFQYGGSGTLLNNLRQAKAGDLFVAADESYIQQGRSKGLLSKVIPLARQRPVVLVARGNPRGIRTLEDLCRKDTRVVLAAPEAASIGRTIRELLEKAGRWDELEEHVAAFEPTVNDVANDVENGAADAGIVWDSTARQHPQLEVVRLSLFDAATETVSVAVLKSSHQPIEALRFARYLGARHRGLRNFEELGYKLAA